MSAFQIIKEGLGMIEREIVHDCDSVEAYVARKFGSVDPAAAGITVVMEGEAQTATELPQQNVEPVINVTPIFGVKPSPYVAGPDAPEGTFTAKSPEDLLKADIAVDTAILAAEQAAHPAA